MDWDILSQPKMSYVALAACTVSRIICIGSIGFLSVFYDFIRDSFTASHFTTSLLFSTASGIMMGTGLIVGILLKKFSERSVAFCGGLMAFTGIISSVWAKDMGHLILTLGIINSVGQGFCFVSTTVSASFVFEEKLHHVAMAVMTMGNGLAYLLFPLFYESLIHVYTWRGTLLVTSALVLNLCVGALLADNPILRRQQCRNLQPTPSKQKRPSCNFQIWKDWKFVFLVTCAFVHCSSYSIYFTFAYTHMTAQGVSKSSAAAVFLAYGFASIITRISVGLLNNRTPWLRRWQVYAYGHFLAGLGSLSFSLLQTDSPAWYSVVMGVIGLANGLIDPLICCTALDVLGPQKLSDSFSFLMFAWGIGGFGGAALGGIVRDKLSSFHIPLAAAGVGEIVAALCLVPLRWTVKYYQQEPGLTPKRVIDVSRLTIDSDDPVRDSLRNLK